MNANNLYGSSSFLPFFQQESGSGSGNAPSATELLEGKEEASFQDIAVKATDSGEDTAEELKEAVDSADKEASSNAPGIGHNQPPVTDPKIAMNRKREKALSRIADFRPSVLNAPALAKEFKETGQFVSEKAIELQVHGGARMAIAVADFVTLANRRLLDKVISEANVKDLGIPKDSNTPVFDVTDPNSLSQIKKAIMAVYFKDESASKTQEKGVLKRFGYSSIASFGSTLNGALKPAVLLMLGVAQVAYTKKTSKLSVKQDVYAKDNVPEDMAIDDLMECIAIRTNRMWRTIILDSGQEGKPAIKTVNKSDNLCVLTPEFANTLYGDETGQFVATEGDDGWLKAPASKREGSSGQGASDKTNSKEVLDKVALAFSDRRSLDKDGNVLKDKDGRDKMKASGYTHAFDWNAATRLCVAMQDMVERWAVEFPHHRVPTLFEAACADMLVALKTKAEVNEDMELLIYNKDARKFLVAQELEEKKNGGSTDVDMSQAA